MAHRVRPDRPALELCVLLRPAWCGPSDLIPPALTATHGLHLNAVPCCGLPSVDLYFISDVGINFRTAIVDEDGDLIYESSQVCIAYFKVRAH